MSDILLVEDSESMAEAYMGFLHKGGFAARHAMSGAAALAAIKQSQPQAVVLDIELPDGSGIDVLRAIRVIAPDVVVIMITAHGTVEKAVTAMRLGAHDFILKPFPAERLLVTLRNALEKNVLQQEVRATGDCHPLIGRSAAMQAVYSSIRHVAGSKVPVFITGESGTGKELAAQALHAHGPRRNGPFRVLNCGAIPASLLESELFGHVRGAFTGATVDRHGAMVMADGGTLFLDEVCEMPVDLQVKLLRAVQTGVVQPVGSDKEVAVDVRLVSATNRNPLDEVRAGRFREDLYYRLYVVPIEMPRLAHRGEDVLLLADHFLNKYASEEVKDFTGFDADARAMLCLNPWPGNVRQLENVIRYVVATKAGGMVTRDDLPPLVLDIAMLRPAMPASIAPSITPLWQVEKQSIETALDRTNGDVGKAAALLEINPSTIYRKLQVWEKSAKQG